MDDRELDKHMTLYLRWKIFSAEKPIGPYLKLGSEEEIAAVVGLPPNDPRSAGRVRDSLRRLADNTYASAIEADLIADDELPDGPERRETIH